MSKFGQSITRIAGGTARSFARFPAAMLSALVIAASASYLIQLDNVSYNRFYQSLQLGFVVAAALGLVVAVLGISRKRLPVWFILVNILTLGAGVGLFFLINQGTGQIPQMTIARVFAGAAVLVLLFMLLISRPSTGSDYNQAAFMTLKSAMIALLYALVILLGSYFIAFSVENLLYQAMSEKVYMHIGVWSAFLWFAFFLGYYPDFSPEVSDPHLETAQKQPRFIEVLFLYVLIPIIAALSIVLLIWVVQILVVGKWPDFEQLSAIFSGYSILGIWLFIMVSHQDKPIARVYRRVFPIVLLIFLAFEAYAIIERVQTTGFMVGEYVVSLIWIYAILSALVFLIKPVLRNGLTAIAAMLLIAVAVLPVTGYLDFTVRSQSNRLYSVLTKNQMIVSDRIQKAPAGISQEDKKTITQTVNYLIPRQRETSIAPWFDGSITSYSQFVSVFGFEEDYDWGPVGPSGNETFLYLPAGTLDVSDYQYAANMGDMNMTNEIEIKGLSGIYQIRPTAIEYVRNMPIIVSRDNQILLEIDVEPYIRGLYDKYRGVNAKEGTEVAFEDMMLKAEQGSLRILIVFQNIQISESSSGSLQYSAYIRTIYLAD